MNAFMHDEKLERFCDLTHFFSNKKESRFFPSSDAVKLMYVGQRSDWTATDVPFSSASDGSSPEQCDVVLVLTPRSSWEIASPCTDTDPDVDRDTPWSCYCKAVCEQTELLEVILVSNLDDDWLSKAAHITEL